jgi:hypothetical protein
MARGRQIGTKNFSAQGFDKKRLRGILFNMSKAVSKGAAKSLEEIAPSFLAYVATTEPGFNDYTGNLADSYAATLFIRRKYVKTFYHSTNRHGEIHHGPRGGRWVALLPPARHNIRRKTLLDEETRRIYRHRHEWAVYDASKAKRYLKKWEKEGGYKGKRTAVKGNASYSASRFGSPYAQNFLRIENHAPYAEMVQQGKGGTHKHYRVLRGSAVYNITKKATALVKAVTLRELKEAGFKVK